MRTAHPPVNLLLSPLAGVLILSYSHSLALTLLTAVRLLVLTEADVFADFHCSTTAALEVTGSLDSTAVDTVSGASLRHY